MTFNCLTEISTTVLPYQYQKPANGRLVQDYFPKIKHLICRLTAEGKPII